MKKSSADFLQRTGSWCSQFPLTVHDKITKGNVFLQMNGGTIESVEKSAIDLHNGGTGIVKLEVKD